MKRSLTDMEILERRRANARAYQEKHHRSTGLGGRAGKKLTDAAFYGARTARAVTPPALAAGITITQCMAGRVRPARLTPKGDA